MRWNSHNRASPSLSRDNSNNPGQLLHGLEAGQFPMRETTDADALINVRLRPNGTQDLSSWLLKSGLEFDGASIGGTGHRFSNNAVSVDVLAPDHVGEWANTQAVPPSRTVQIPAGTRLLKDAALCPVTLSSGSVGHIPRPSLEGAIVGKSAALGLDDSARHAEDLAFLFGLVPNPREITAALSKSDRRHLMRAKTLLTDESVWRYSHDPDAAQAALHFLIGK